MPAKVWTLQSDFETWTLVHLSATKTPGMLEIEDGYNSGTGTTPVYEAASWDHWSKVILNGSRPQGTNIYLRYRTATTQGGCEAADWSEYIDGLDADGYMSFDLRVHILNNAVAEGAFVQFEVTLVGE